MDRTQLAAKWNAEAKKLVGKTIVEARYLTPKEAEEMGWDESGVVLFLSDKTQIIISRDDEANGPGALLVGADEVLPVI